MVETCRIMESSFGNDVPLAYSDKFGDVISTCFVRGTRANNNTSMQVTLT